VRTRRQQLRDLCRKYGDGLDEVQRYHREVAEQVANLESFETRAAALDDLRRLAADAYRIESEAVGAARRDAAPRLARAVARRLGDLAMPNASISVDVDDVDGSRVQLLLSANPGSPPLPLNKVASGGELARTMLALRLVMIGNDASAAAPSTLIFDEVDAGIGGSAATAVALALAEVARTHQVLVVTHLAQVAAQAATQIAVAKGVLGEETTATAALVTGRERVEEIARMLSGDLGGEAAVRHAVELLGARRQ